MNAIQQRLASLSQEVSAMPRRKLDAQGYCIGGSAPIIRPTDSAAIVDITNHVQRRAARKREDRERCIAVLDMETDPFDNTSDADIAPFLAVLYSDQFEPIVIWEEDSAKFTESVIRSISELPGHYTIYAHNGGKFDYMFLLNRLRGLVTFKGRGLMSASVGQHTLRDSFHIIPERLANWKKDVFAYDTLRRSKRGTYRDSIIEYCLNDCKYLLQIIRRFVRENGLALSIGQASLKRLRREYPSIQTIGEHTDGLIRGVNTDASDREGYNKTNGQGYFYGGRVECIAGAGRFIGRYKLYDVNSMYPYCMSAFSHPIGANYSVRKGRPTEKTAFLHLSCVNRGALMSKGEDGETTGDKRHGEFYTTIHEYNAAIELGLIHDITVHHCIDCDQFGSFERFILPIYHERQQTKGLLADLERKGRGAGDIEWDNTKLRDIFLKLYLNNAYGKFAQNPRRFHETMLTGLGPGSGLGTGKAPDLSKWQEIFRSEDSEHPECSYIIWQSRGPVWNERMLSYDAPHYRFYNIGTGASITGAARSVLLRAICSAKEPLYCDTDSLICKSLGDVPISVTELGAWKCEREFDEVIIVGKKQYACRLADTKVGRNGLPTRPKDVIVRNKGVADVTFKEMLSLLDDTIVTKVSTGPTLTKFGDQYYMRRQIRRTAPNHASLIGEHNGVANTG